LNIYSELFILSIFGKRIFLAHQKHSYGPDPKFESKLMESFHLINLGLEKFLLEGIQSSLEGIDCLENFVISLIPN